MNNALIPLQSVRRYIKQAASCGIDCSVLLRAANISESQLTDNSTRIPTFALSEFLASVIPQSKDPYFGLHTAKYIQADSFDILGFIALNCASLRESLEQVILYEKITGESGNTELMTFDDNILVCWQAYDTNPLVRRHTTEAVLASWISYTTKIIQVENIPLQVWLEHEPAKGGNDQHYQEIFNCEVLFNQPASGILITKTQLDMPFPQANSDILQALQQQASRSLADQDSNLDTVHKVKNRIRLMLTNSIPSKELIAEQMGISGRTLQRQLKQEGFSYKEILQQVRREIAEHYLCSTRLSQDDIAHKLGFSDSRSFQRSFKIWTSITPGAFRKNYLSESKPPLLKP